MEHNESHKRDLKVQIREAFGRVVYTYTTHLKQAEFLVKKNSTLLAILAVTAQQPTNYGLFESNIFLFLQTSQF